MRKQIATRHESSGSSAAHSDANGDRLAPTSETGGRLTSEDVEAIAEATARKLTEVAREPPRTFALVDPRELAIELGVSLHYVYAHASELGAMRFGTGPKARIRFDLDRARQALEARSAPAHEAREIGGCMHARAVLSPARQQKRSLQRDSPAKRSKRYATMNLDAHVGGSVMVRLAQGHVFQRSWSDGETVSLDRLEEAMAALGVPIDESFRVFARRWWRSEQLDLDVDTINDYEWRLGYLERFFGRHRLNEITPQLVDRFRDELHEQAQTIRRAQERAEAEKGRRPLVETITDRRGRTYERRRRPLSNTSIN